MNPEKSTISPNTSLIDDLIALTTLVDNAIRLPSIQTVVLPPSGSVKDSKYRKFGLMILDDGSAGFFYRLLDISQDISQCTSQQVALEQLQGTNPATLAPLLREADSHSCGIAMAAINAISQHVFKRASYLPQAGNADQAAKLERIHLKRPQKTQEDHIGLVGYFSPMVATLQKKRIKTTVLELDNSLYCNSDLLTITSDISKLSGCNQVYCTASTLLNGSLESLLTELAQNCYFELIGPTCGCFADPFFSRNVDSLGSSTVVDPRAAAHNIHKLLPWGSSVAKYSIRADATENTYPGINTLLDNIN